MSDVFISYSRKNSDFARRLIDHLTLAKKESWVDWEGIPLSSPNWWNEIKEGIESADSFIFIMSPDSMASVVCNLELDYANELQKRIIPVVHQEIESREAFASIADFEADEAMRERLEGKDSLVIARDNWQRLSHINWVFFREVDEFDAAFAQLVETVETDLEYVKAHTRYLTRAREWERMGKPDDLLLFGEEIDRAEKWLQKAEAYRSVDEASAKTNVVNPLAQNIQRKYIATSRLSEEDRKRREARQRQILRYALGGLAAVILVSAVGLAAIFAQNNAELQAEVNFLNLEMARFGTLQAVNIIVPIGTQTPGIFEPTMTTNAMLSSHDPSLPENRLTDEFGVKMVRVPAGCFFMGSENGDEDEKPTHQICLPSFWIDEHEVTNEEFGSVGCPGRSSEPNQPRNCVTWFEAQAHCELRGARLPTEAEWEYAARGVDSYIYAWGNEWNPDRANWDGSEAAEVGSFPEGASWVGAFDMSGNLHEWTSSAYQPYPYSDDSEDTNNNTVPRVYRGGSFFTGTFDLRTANRSRNDPAVVSRSGGFRCARDIVE